MDHEMELRKALETLTSTAFAFGGSLNPEQAKTFISMIRDNSAALADVRHVNMSREKLDIDRMYIGEPVTRGVAEGTTVANPNRPHFKKLQLSVNGNKLQSYWPVTYESMQVALEQGQKLEQTIYKGASRAIASDLERLFWQGDDSISGTTTPEDLLLKDHDGMGILTQQGHVLDADGANIEFDLFAAAIRALPVHISAMANDLNWWMSTQIAIDWIAKLTGRATPRGDDSLEGVITNPFGIPIWKKKGGARYGVPWMPSTLDLPVSTATAAQWVGTRQSPFELDASHNVFVFNIDGLGDITVTMTANVYMASEVAAAFNAAIVAAGGGYTSAYYHCWSDDGYGHLVCTSPTTGGASTIKNEDTGIVSTARIPLGFNVDSTGAIIAPGTDITYTGAAAGSNTVKEGSYLLLTPAENMIWAVYTGPAGGRPGDGIRVYSKYEPEDDTLTVYFYTQYDIAIEQPDALVRVDNIRRKDYV